MKKPLNRISAILICYGFVIAVLGIIEFVYTWRILAFGIALMSEGLLWIWYRHFRRFEKLRAILDGIELQHLQEICDADRRGELAYRVKVF